MDTASLINDSLIMASAIGSAIAGVVCGWQLRGTHELKKNAEAVTESAISVGIADLSSDVEPSSTPPTAQDDLSFLPDRPVKKVLFEEPGDSFLQYSDSFAAAYGEQPQGLSQNEIREVAERLISMAESISADVDAHDAQLTEVNTSLESKQTPPTMDSVMSAVEKLLQANQEMQGQLRSSRDQIVEQARQIEMAEKRANTDALTQVSNRRAFDRTLAEWTGETPGVLALLDIDHFKKFNDQYGHRAGDEVLRAVANVLKSNLKQHCLVARYGGEEFGLVFTNHRLEDVLDLIEDARTAIAANEVIFENQSFRVSCSLGVTRMLIEEPSTEWLQRADDGLYLSKDAGRDCGHCIDAKTAGIREKSFRLGKPSKAVESTAPDSDKDRVAPKQIAADKSAPTGLKQRQLINSGILERTPNCASLGESYRELLQRLGKAPVKLSVVALTVNAPEQEVEVSDTFGVITRFAKLLEVTQNFCRAVDRIGCYDSHTLLLCMPGTEADSIIDRVVQLREIVSTQLQVDDAELHIGAASLQLGDTFELLVSRAIDQACATA